MTGVGYRGVGHGRSTANCGIAKRAASTLRCDVVVIGGGHAGCEAAAAAARAGADTILLSQSIATIGEMSCNPSFGGIGKGTLVREIDALDGLMARCVDEAGIQFRILNRSKGPAVQAPRAQADRTLYAAAMLGALRGVAGLRLHEDSAEDLILTGEGSSRAPQIAGVRTGRGDEILCRSVVIATGTFLRGVVHLGTERYPAGRHRRDSADVEPPTTALAATLDRLRFPLHRLTTGTPPRLDGTTIRYEGLEEQRSDDPPPAMSYLNDERGVRLADSLVSCHLTATVTATHDLVRAHSSSLPTFAGNNGRGQGPRYCPSIEKKVVRFPGKTSHSIWLEPEGLDSTTVYPSGLNTAFPPDVQLALLRTIPGLEGVRMVRPGYAVEYEAVDASRCLRTTLEARDVRGLYLCGQVRLACSAGNEAAAAVGRSCGAASTLPRAQLFYPHSRSAARRATRRRVPSESSPAPMRASRQLAAPRLYLAAPTHLSAL